MAEARRVRMRGCARCQGEGHELTFIPFTRPVKTGGLTFTHWAICPTLNEPILLRSVSMDEAQREGLLHKPGEPEPVKPE